MSDRLARVLAHPLRDRVLYEYQDAPACASDVARRIGRPVNLVSYHTGVLARHGFLELVRSERRRGALTRFYRSTVGQLIGEGDWCELPPPLRHTLVLRTLFQLTEEARRAAVHGGFDGAHAHLVRLDAELDPAAEQAVSQVLQRAFADVSAIVAGARGRPGTTCRYEVAIFGFAPAAAVTGPASSRHR